MKVSAPSGQMCHSTRKSWLVRIVGKLIAAAQRWLSEKVPEPCMQYRPVSCLRIWIRAWAAWICERTLLRTVADGCASSFSAPVVWWACR